MAKTVRRKRTKKRTKKRRDTLPKLRVLTYKNKKHKYKLSDPHKKRRKALDAGIRAERKTKKSRREAATAKKARLNVLRIYRKNKKPGECRKLTQDMKYIDAKYGLGETKDICKKTKKRTSGKTRKRRSRNQKGGSRWSSPWRQPPTEQEMAIAEAQAIKTKDPGLYLTLSEEESTDEQRPGLRDFIRPYGGPIINRTRRIPIRIHRNWINYFFTRWKDNNRTASMTREQRNEFNRVGIRIKKNLSKLYGCEQLDLIFQDINDIISGSVDRTWLRNKAVVKQYRDDGLSEEDITKGIEQSVLQGLHEEGAIAINLRKRIDDGGGIYIPSLNLCISGHEIREIYAPHLAKGEQVRKEVKGMKVKALKKRAKEIGVDEGELEDVDYREDVKVAIITLILKQIDHPPEGISEDIWRKVKRILQADDYVNEEVRKIHKLYDEIKGKSLPLPPPPEQTQEKIESYEKMMNSWWRPTFKKYFSSIH